MKYKKTKSETVNTSDNMTPPSVMPQGTPPAKPDGDTNRGHGGSAPDGAPGGSSSGVTSYDAVKSITSDTTISDDTIKSTGTDENAINISNGATVGSSDLDSYISAVKSKRADAGHELKTPLTIIDTNTEVIETENGESQWTKSIRNQVDRLTSMVGQFITLSKMEEKNENFHKTDISLNIILNESLEPFDAVLLSKNIKINTSSEKDIHISGDEKLLRQLFEILIDNAAKYASENSTFSISMKRKSRKNMLIFENESDTISEGNLDILFDRFYRTDASRNSAPGGSGIGLSVAKSIVTLHGGTIHAKSDDGKKYRLLFLCSTI